MLQAVLCQSVVLQIPLHGVHLHHRVTDRRSHIHTVTRKPILHENAYRRLIMAVFRTVKNRNYTVMSNYRQKFIAQIERAAFLHAQLAGGLEVQS